MTMRPRFTLAIVYLFLFFFLYCFALILPALWDILQNTPVGPEQQELARRVAQETVQPRLHIVAALAIATTGAGMYWHFLPGMRE
jgi:hypothetical protein